MPKSVSAQDKQWICKTHHSALKQGVLPAQAKANKLDLDDIPVKLSDLNPLEICLISLRIPFMKMVALPCGKQRAIHGPAINVPTDLTSSAMASISNLYEAERKLCYKGTLHVPVRSTNKGTCSSTVVEIEQPTVQGCRDQQ